MTRSNNRAVALWLLLCCALIYAMVVLGGVTRLTHSGLSMVDWDPIMGVVPPVSDTDWQAAFDQYKHFPEYRQVNQGMSLGAFKRIFYVEYGHRMLGRLIGLVFLVPLMVFVLLGYITRPMIPRFAAMFVLGGMQGLLGWFMVRSGLVDRPSVSQYRLASHLILAVLIYGFILWSALSLWRGTTHRSTAGTSRSWYGWGVVAIVLIMITSGGFVAGTHAGFVFNTFPTMGGHWLPPGIWSLSPGWRNLFENVATVQFLHRCLAVVVVLTVSAYGIVSLRRAAAGSARLSAGLMLLALVVQVGLGISTLLLRVPVPLGAGHQAGALALLTLVLIHTHCLKYAGPGMNRQPDAGTGHAVARGAGEPL
ncbi:MAG: COX15/CtaA family protein [Arenicellales bacterium]